MSSKPIRVLVVDDEEVVRLNMAAYLEDEGFEVEAVIDGEDALRVLSRAAADVGVIDMRLPGIDGDHVILEAHKLWPKMRFLIHTGSASYRLSNSLRALDIQDEHLFLKPIKDMAVVGEAIRRLIAEQEP